MAPHWTDYEVRPHGKLRNADLEGANLEQANLDSANMQGAKLIGANLREAILCGANLEGADMSGANLGGANLRGANLKHARLGGAFLRYAHLQDADLRDADLENADLERAVLRGANLQGAHNLPPLVLARLSIIPGGDVIGWTSAVALDGGSVLVKLLIPSDAKRSNATGRQCRAEYALVLEVIGADEARSSGDLVYRPEEIVIPPEPFDEDRFNEWSTGIHFFLTQIEAAQ
jgi:hypothetical protein